MTDLGYDQAMQLRAALMPIAYLLCTLGLLLSVFRNWGNFHEILMTIIGIAVIVIVVNGYPTTLVTIADAFKDLREQTTANAPGNAQQPSWTNIFSVKFEQPSWDEFAEKIEIAICQAFKWIGKVAILLLDWVQSWAFNGLIAISPVLLGMLALPWTQGVGITFLTTSFGVAAWHLGIALVDILLASVATQLFAAAGITGGVAAAVTISVGLLPIFLGALVAVVIAAIVLYLAVPLVIAAVLRGSSPLTTAASSGMQMMLTALGLGTMAGSQIAAKRAAANFKAGGSQSRSEGNSKGSEGGGESGLAPQPLAGPPGGGLSSSLASSTSKTRKKDETDDDSPTQRQSKILAGYDSAGAGHAPSQSQNRGQIPEQTSRREGQSRTQVAEQTPGTDQSRGLLVSRPSENELERRKAESQRVLRKRDENYT